MDQVTVKILDREYRLSCEPGEREKLLAAVAHVDANMQTIRTQGKIAGSERIAVFAALNIAGELLAKSASKSDVKPRVRIDEISSVEPTVADEEIVRRMQSINALLDTALVDQERLF